MNISINNDYTGDPDTFTELFRYHYGNSKKLPLQTSGTIMTLGNEDQGNQLFICNQINKIFSRIKINGTWQKWVTII